MNFIRLFIEMGGRCLAHVELITNLYVMILVLFQGYKRISHV